jgi:hypothetical protein
VGEAHQRVHQAELPRVVELEAGDALSGRLAPRSSCAGGGAAFGAPHQWATVAGRRPAPMARSKTNAPIAASSCLYSGLGRYGMIMQ